MGSRFYRASRLRVSRCDALPPSMQDGVREITEIITELAERRKGDARGLMEKVCKEADENGMVLILFPKPFSDGCMDENSLERFYARHGFVATQSEPIMMVRKPNG